MANVFRSPNYERERERERVPFPMDSRRGGWQGRQTNGKAKLQVGNRKEGITLLLHSKKETEGQTIIKGGSCKRITY